MCVRTQVAQIVCSHLKIYYKNGQIESKVRSGKRWGGCELREGKACRKARQHFLNAILASLAYTQEEFKKRAHKLTHQFMVKKCETGKCCAAPRHSSVRWLRTGRSYSAKHNSDTILMITPNYECSPRVCKCNCNEDTPPRKCLPVPVVCSEDGEDTAQVVPAGV